MKIRRSKHFKKSYQKLSPVLQKRVDKALMLLAMNVRHPSLRVKKVQGTDDIYELRVTTPIALASRAIGAIGSALRSRRMAISCVEWGNTMICCAVLEKCNRGTLAMYSQETAAMIRRVAAPPWSPVVEEGGSVRRPAPAFGEEALRREEMVAA